MQVKQTSISRFFQMESAGGICLMLAALAAVMADNSPLQPLYDQLLNMPVEVRVGALQIAKPLLLWINDGLMAVFFFLVGLELKREIVEGELSDIRKIVLPGVGAIGGMAIPSLVYVLFNLGDSLALKGWAIPAATDIAFALGILALLGPRVPLSLKIFLTSLAIFDDMGAIVIIALFYTADLSITALIVVLACLPVLLVMNRRGVESKSAYIFIGIIMWVAMLKSGVHATLAGVIMAMFIPLRSKSDENFSPLKDLEHDLHPVVAFMVLPIFAFANAGVSVAGMEFEQFLHPVPMGIMLGLFVGKPIGIFVICWAAIKVGLARLPDGMNFLSLYGVSTLCGVGFTMSFFIATLAFGQADVDLIFDERLGVILGSVLSGGLGYILLKRALRNHTA
ncbi:Na+/H+ antiporter NhaA [Desulfopila aestuarii]|uniref:Na(+)/H(+) antiporter NhaA n=1 Tax=Desulfopila aestuarii DSM 18488 TaxID=1121416 RepID=A0A1M7YD76_9BACT|nr:Na+/H+ antiporter NhaA [Desulfopila aestuarii]SHO50458.1 sodium/proton antiporter, NhaA family [Desulfopila aestuarii DSM 18488]